MFGAIAGGIASALAGGAMSKLFGGGQKAASGGIQGDVLATDNNTVGMGDARSEERFSRNAETDLVCRLLLEKKKKAYQRQPPVSGGHPQRDGRYLGYAAVGHRRSRDQPRHTSRG